MADEDDDEVLGCATTASGQSASTSSLPPPADNTLLKLNHLDLHADDAGSQASLASVLSILFSSLPIAHNAVYFREFDFYYLKIQFHSHHSGKKKKRGQRAVGPDKSGRGLRQFSMKGKFSSL